MRYHDIIEDSPLQRSVLGNPNFWRWFKNSKVVDETGKPQVTYHATFSQFDVYYAGSHFGDTTAANDRWKSFAKNNEYPRFSGHRGAVMPVYLSIQNPLRIEDDGGLSDGFDLADAALKVSAITRDEYKIVRDVSYGTTCRLRLFNLLEEKGYDGLVYQNRIEGNADSWVIFRPNQVKSVFNRGSFSSADNIMENGD